MAIFLVLWLLVGLFIISQAVSIGAPLWFIGFACAILFIGLFGALAAILTQQRRRALPPPPPIQQPMVPLQTAQPAELACPNCGAPPGNVDRFGIATCDYCGTRFLAR